MNDTLLHVMMQPLSISMLEETLPANVSHEPGEVALRLIGDFIGASESPLDAARARYRDVSDKRTEPDVVPMHPTIMDHVVRPLVEAKQCYVLGMPVACIAQAGLVGEMVALWRFRMLSPTIDGRPLDEEMQKLLMGKPFDNLTQYNRVRTLKALDSLDEDTIKAFDDLRKMRNSYLHYMIDHTRNVDADARQALGLATTLVAKTLGVQFNEGRLVLPDRVARFIREMLEPDEDQPSSQD